MIVADTNVMSEPLRRSPDPLVLGWIRSVGPDIALTSVTVGELLYGAERLPDGRRRRGLLEAIERLMDEAGDRLLAYDAAAARAYASLRVAREAAGRSVSSEDLMIAGICLAHGLPIATRNVRHFAGFGLEVVDPWGGAPA